MNKVMLCGRLTDDPVIRQAGDKQVAQYVLAVDRHVARNNGEQTADFIRCVAWEKRAQFAERYLHKGTKIIITGRIQTGSYTDRDGKKIYTTDVVIEEQEFAESKGSAEKTEPKTTEAKETDFLSITAGMQEELPFN